MWNDMRVYPTFFDNERDFFNTLTAADPQNCICGSIRAHRVLDITSTNTDIPANASKFDKTCHCNGKENWKQF